MYAYAHAERAREGPQPPCQGWADLLQWRGQQPAGKCPRQAFFLKKVRNRVTKAGRERQAAQGRERDWAESLSGTEDTELLLIRREQAELLRECLKTLPQREIDLLNYAYTLELSSKEITRLTGLAPGNVRQILTRARRKVLAAYIEKGGMNHE